MTLISLKPITKYNWEDAINLTVKEDQKNCVASNLHSIAQVQFLDDFFAKGIYLKETMIGFTMYGIDPDDQNYWIYRLMIDKDYQGKGYSSIAIEKVIEEIKLHNNQNIPFIMIGYNLENIAAKNCYKKAGFVETEVAPWGEQLAQYSIL